MDTLPRETIVEATNWMARLWADDVSDQDQQEFSYWLNANPNHARAWQQLERLQGKFTQIPQTSLSRRILTSRRNALGRREFLILGGVSLGVLGLSYSNYSPFSSAQLYATAIGEMKSLTFVDGTELTLNTSTRISVSATNAQPRVHVIEGEVLVKSPLTVNTLTISTAQGCMVPHQANFAVRKHQQRSQITVYQGTVEVSAAQGISPTHLVAGQLAYFTRQWVEAIESHSQQAALWIEQKIEAQSTPLTQFIEELGRYRRGVISIDKRLNTLKLSGVFSTKDVDQTLYHISQVLPIEIHYRTPLWIKILPRT